MQRTLIDPATRRQTAPWPYYSEDEVRAATDVLASGKVNYWTGDEGRNFEKEYAAYLGRHHAVALSNGTVALELALLSFDIGPGSDVITTPRTFVATAAAVVNRGCRPVFADVDRDSGNLSAETVEAALTPDTRAVIAVHLGGWPCDMEPLRELARDKGLLLIEDCAQAHGAFDRDRPVGSFGDAAAFSFCQDKIISTGGEGGLLALDDEAAWRRAWSYKDHGKDYDAVFTKEHPPGFRWVHESIGSNLRMTEFQAALGRVQMRKLERWVWTRKRNAGILADHLSQLPAVRVPVPPSHLSHAYYRFYFYIRPEALKISWDRDRILAEVSAAGVRCTIGSCGEIYRERALRDRGLEPTTPLQNAQELAETSLALEVHPTLEPAMMDQVGTVVAEVIASATR